MNFTLLNSRGLPNLGYICRMEWIDIIIAAYLAYAVYKGFRRGFVLAALTLLSLSIGIYLTLRFSVFTKEWLLYKNIGSGDTAGLLAFVFTFLGVLIGIHFLGQALTKILSTLYMGLLNRIAGAIFELLKAIFICSVFFNLFHKINYNHLLVSEEKLAQSILFKPLENTTRILFPLMQEWYEKGWNNIKNELEPDKSLQKSEWITD